MRCETLKAFRAIERLYESLGAAFLFSISGLMALDVIGRYFLDMPVKGAFDLVEALMALCAFWFLPLLSRDAQHISVTIFRAQRGWRAWLQNSLVELICVAVALLMGYSLFSIATEFASYNEASFIIGLPKAPFIYVCGGVSILMALTHLVRFFRAVFGLGAVK